MITVYNIESVFRLLFKRYVLQFYNCKYIVANVSYSVKTNGLKYIDSTLHSLILKSEMCNFTWQNRFLGILNYWKRIKR